MAEDSLKPYRRAPGLEPEAMPQAATGPWLHRGCATEEQLLRLRRLARTRGDDPETAPGRGGIRRAAILLGMPQDLLAIADPEVFERLLELCRQGVDLVSLSAFDLLTSLASPELEIRIGAPANVEEKEEGGGRLPSMPDLAATRLLGPMHDEPASLAFGADTTAPISVAIEEPIEVRLALPPALHGAQALLLERDAEGAISLLSLAHLVGGALRWRHEVVVPRSDGRIDGSGSLGELCLALAGKSELLMILCAADDLRLDRWPAFLKLEEQMAGAVPGVAAAVPSLGEADLRELMLELFHRPERSWAVARRWIEVENPRSNAPPTTLPRD